MRCASESEKWSECMRELGEKARRISRRVAINKRMLDSVVHRGSTRLVTGLVTGMITSESTEWHCQFSFTRKEDDGFKFSVKDCLLNDLPVAGPKQVFELLTILFDPFVVVLSCIVPEVFNICLEPALERF